MLTDGYLVSILQSGIAPVQVEIDRGLWRRVNKE
jgi:hypothetical protein